MYRPPELLQRCIGKYHIGCTCTACTQYCKVRTAVRGACTAVGAVPLGAHRSTSPGTGTGRAGCGIVGARKARSWRVDSATFARFGSACQQPQVRGTRHEAPAPRGSVCLRMQRSSGNLKATRRRSMQPPAGARAVACSRSSMVRAAAPPPPVAGALTRWHGHR